MLANVTQWWERDVATQQRGNITYIRHLPVFFTSILSDLLMHSRALLWHILHAGECWAVWGCLERADRRGLGGGGTHLGLPLLQQRLQPLLGGAALVVVTDYQDNVVPVEFPHQVEPDVGLVGVWRHRPQEGQVDALPRGPAIKCETWACINDLRLL